MPLVSIIVPTYNSSKNLTDFLQSFVESDFQDFEIIVNDDDRTDDATPEVIQKFEEKGLNLIYKRENILMAQARKKGAEYAVGKYIMHLDSDMKVSKKLLDECVVKIKQGFDALVIPEESFGTTFWAKCKWLEKKCYEGVENIESLRFLKRKIYNKLDGHNEKMVFSEDKDFDLRVRAAGYKIGRVKNVIYHNEGDLHLWTTLRKKLGYTHTANIFAEQHPEAFRWQTNILNRYVIYLKNIKYLFIYPLLYIGMIVMKTTEFAFGGLGMLIGKIKK